MHPILFIPRTIIDHTYYYYLSNLLLNFDKDPTTIIGSYLCENDVPCTIFNYAYNYSFYLSVDKFNKWIITSLTSSLFILTIFREILFIALRATPLLNNICNTQEKLRKLQDNHIQKHQEYFEIFFENERNSLIRTYQSQFSIAQSKNIKLYKAMLRHWKKEATKLKTKEKASEPPAVGKKSKFDF